MGTPSKANWLRLCLLGLIWGASFLAVSLALRDFGPLMLAAARITLAAVILMGVALAKGAGLPNWNGPNGKLIWLCALIIALATNAVPFALLSWAQQSVASGFAGVCMAVVPLIVLPLAHVFVPGEQMHLRRVIGFLIGSFGVIVLIGPGAFASTGAETELLARIACVAASCCYAIGSITTRRCPEVNFFSLAAAVMLLASLILLPFALVVEGLPSQVTPVPFMAILYLGLLPTAIAQLLLVRIVREAGPTFMSLVNYQVPVWSVILGAVILSEPLPASLFLALGLILIGLAISQWGALKRMFAGSNGAT